MASNTNSTGYGPSILKNRLYFDGNPENYPIWETRFLNYLYTQDEDLYIAILPKPSDQDNKDNFNVKNRRAYAELVQVLDERSLQLIMADAPNDGRVSLSVLREHYASTEKPRVLSLYEELTTIQLRETEDITDYLIRAERATTGLRTSGEQISDILVIAMILKGLTDTYKPFVVVHTQLDKLNSTTAAERDYACTALGMYLSETKTLQYVLEKDTVRTIGCLLQDEKPQVVLAATGLLKSISEEGGFDSCEVMIKQGVITFATNLIKKAHKMWSESSLKEDFLLHSVINSITMLQNLCETSNLGITICLEEGVVPVLLEFIKFENTQLLQTTIEYLYTVSEENELVISLLNQSEHLNQFNKIIMQEKDDTSYTLIRITTIGIISNITEISSIREGVIPSILLTTLQINTHEKLQSVSTSCHNKKQSNGAELSGGEAGLNGEEETMDQDEQQMEVNEEKKKEKKSNTPLQDANENFTELSNIILSQKLTFEILSNVITTADSDVGDWCDIDDDSASEPGSINSIEHDEMMNDDQDGGLLSPLFSLLVKEDIILLICRRIQFINDELYKVLKRSDKSIQEQIKHAINQYSKMLSSALFCFNNILQHVNVEQLGGLPAVTKLFTQLVITCSQQHVSESDVLQESVLHAARALVEVIKNNNSESLAVSSVLIEKIKEMTLVKDLDTAVNAVKILALLAQLNNTPADIVQLVSEWYMELMKTRNELWLIAETLDSIIDIFSEDDYDHVIRKVELITFLQAAPPVFTKLVRSRDKSDKTHNAVINTVKSNLPRFIKYKINSLRNL